jgi:L-ascorbate metabolism protein UlaG (beta-lactamase superfamily)
VPNPFERLRKPRAEIRKAGKDAGQPPSPLPARKVSLRPSSGWMRRNFLTEVLIPSLFAKREGQPLAPVFPRLSDSDVGLTWIGHASFLVQTSAMSVLIDPNWAGWLKGIKRIRHPGLSMQDLPSIDLVLVTHAHFDHLDRKSLRGVAANQPIVVPFEVGNLVHDLGFHTVHELGYWESHNHSGVCVTLTPCHHWGARLLHDSHRGFGGYLIQAAGRTVFHCGDTAYFDGFAEIGRRHPIDVALLPIGAYDPPSGREVHMNPEQAVRAFLELGARYLVPMHYGSFRLSYEPLDEPLERFLTCARAHGIEDRIRVMTEGVPLVV